MQKDCLLLIDLVVHDGQRRLHGDVVGLSLSFCPLTISSTDSELY